MKLTRTDIRRGDEPILFNVDVARLGYVVPFGESEPNMDRSTGEHRRDREGRPLWRVDAGVPGCKVSSVVGMAIVRVNVASATEPDVAAYSPYTPEGEVILTGRTEGERDQRQGYLNIKCAELVPYEGSTEQGAEPEIAGVPVSIRSDEPLVVLAVGVPRSQWDGRAITDAGKALARLQVQVNLRCTRKETNEQFTSRETLFVDVPEAIKLANPLGFMARVELLGLRCDARVAENGRLNMDLRAAGYRVLDGPSPASNGRTSRKPAAWEAAQESVPEPAA